MKKLISLISVMLVSSFIMAGSFEITPRVSMKTFSEDELDSGTGLGLQFGYYFNDNLRVKLYYETYSADTEWNTDVSTTSGRSTYSFRGNFDVETDVNTLLVGADYLISKEKIDIYFGGGVGQASLDASISDSRSSSINVDFDSALVIGVNGGISYKINDRFSIGGEASYLFGTADYDFSYTFSAFTSATATFAEELDVNNFNITIHGSVKLG